MEQTPQAQKTFASENAEYPLVPAKFYSITNEIKEYLSGEKAKEPAARKVAYTASPIIEDGQQKLLVRTESIEEHSSPRLFTLAELILNADNSSLTLKINAHPSIAIDPSGLVRIAKMHQPK